MRILQVSKKPPWPPKDGETIAISSITKGIIDAGHEVTVAAISTPKHPGVQPAGFGHEMVDLHSVFVDTSLNFGSALGNFFFSQEPYQITRFLSHEFSQLLQRLIREKEFDIIQLEGLALTEYLQLIRHTTKAPVVMRSHNVEHLIWYSVSRNERNPIKKLYLRNLAKRLRRYELSHVNDYDGLIPITETDADFFRQHGCSIPIMPLPTGLELTMYQRNGTLQRDHVFIFASWDWAPNQQGLWWFLDQVWPRLKTSSPGLKLVLAGRNAPESVRQMSRPDVDFVGEVEDGQAFFRRNGVMAVPLLAGSGLRVKIVEAMAAGVPVVSTSIGAQGVNGHDGEHYLIADEPGDFANAITRCLSDTGLQSSLSEHAASFARDHFDIRQTTARLLEFYNTLRS